MAYTLDFDLALGVGKAGLTLAAQLVDSSAVDVGSEVTTGFTEIGDGCYLWHYAAIPDGHRGGVKFYEDGVPGAILAFKSINPEEGENITFLVNIGGGRWRIVDNQMIFYEADNETEVMRFNLKNLAGDAAMADVFERVRV